MSFYEELKLHLQAGVPAIYVESSEWKRFHDVVKQCCKGLRRTLYFWNPVDGLTDSKNPKVSEDEVSEDDTADFVAVLGKIIAEGKKGDVYVLEFADDFYTGANENVAPEFAATIRKLRDKSMHVIVLSPTLGMPKILEKEFTMMDFPLPGREEIQKLLTDAAGKHHSDDASRILDSVRGLGASEITNAFAKIAALHHEITAKQIPDLVAEKAQIIRKSGYLTFVRTDNDMDSIGGLENLRKWLKRRKNAFGEEAREKKLNAPKGVLLLGVPGTGKSLCAKAVAREWQMPLLRLDMGSIFSGIVGSSESNMRGAIKVAESMEPCILWIDEIEKGMSGGSSRELDGGTSSRVFGAFLTWMQEKTKEVFIFATANNISRLPPEMLRKGRFDEIFFVDLPDRDVRKDIFKIHLENKRQDVSLADNDDLITATRGFSGAEIEAVVNDALSASYTPGNTPVINAQSMQDAAEEIVPLSDTMSDEIAKIRKWVFVENSRRTRCRLANSDNSKEGNGK